MAEVVISAVVKQLVSLALDQITGEVSLLTGVQEKVENLKRNLRSIGAVIQDAENKRWSNSSDSESVKVWLETLEDDSQEMANMLDKWNSTLLKSKIEREQIAGEKKKVTFFLPSSWFCFPKVNRLIPHREISHKIQELDEKVTKTADQIGQLGLIRNIMRANPDIEVEGRLETTSLVDETKIHGRKEDEKVLLDMLMLESSHGGLGQLEVISIVGMGGLGKTTLAQLAFNNEIVKNHFSKRIWVCVSDPFDLPQIASKMTENLKDYSSNEQPKFQTLEGAFNWISRHLKGVRFLLVLDDVWNEEYSKWEPLETTLKKLDAAGSKVLVTTRNEKVAHVMGAAASRMVNLKELTHEECQLIFEQRAFREKNEEDIKDLRDIGSQIVKKCKGLPLAAKALGGLMHFKRTRQEWEDVLHSQLWKLNVPQVDKYLFGPFLLSYLDLSSLEKRCLLHSSIYPKDHLISRMELIELWMSEGYLSSEKSGACVFQNLAMRSFFQDFQERDAYDEGNVVCKMHDILHDFVHYLSKRECEIIELCNIRSDKMTLRLGERTRHLTIAMESGAQFPNLVLTRDNKKFLHTFLILRQGFDDFSVDSSMFSSLTHLRTLNLSKCGFKRLPGDIGNLILLRYLELSNNPLVELPDTICNLCNLQTLKMETGCGSLEELPKGMGKLVNLRNLYIGGCQSLRGLPKGIRRLTNLQILDWYFIPADETKYLTLRELTKMNCKLKISRLNLALQGPVNEEQVMPEIPKVDLSTWEHLNEIILITADDNTFKFFEPHPKLKVLQVKYYFGYTFPSSWMSLNFLRDIEFYDCQNLKTLPSFGKLPSLESLHFKDLSGLRAVGPEFLGLMDDDHQEVPLSPIFPKLKQLKFTNVYSWYKWEGKVPAANPSLQIMPCLHTLRFTTCAVLQELPHFLRTVPLQFLYIDAQCFWLLDYCKSRKAGGWPNISHVQNIIIESRHLQKDGHYLGTY